jgi:hypothetical protein
MSDSETRPVISRIDPRLRLDRSQTLMKGGDFCDFRYRLTQD